MPIHTLPAVNDEEEALQDAANGALRDLAAANDEHIAIVRRFGFRTPESNASVQRVLRASIAARNAVDRLRRHQGQ